MYNSSIVYHDSLSLAGSSRTVLRMLGLWVAEAREGRLRVPATVSLPSYNLVLGHRGSHLSSCYRSGVSRAGDSRPSRGYYNRRSR